MTSNLVEQEVLAPEHEIRDEYTSFNTGDACGRLHFSSLPSVVSWNSSEFFSVGGRRRGEAQQWV
jgi:hypothetical protein